MGHNTQRWRNKDEIKKPSIRRDSNPSHVLITAVLQPITGIRQLIRAVLLQDIVKYKVLLREE